MLDRGTRNLAKHVIATMSLSVLVFGFSACGGTTKEVHVASTVSTQIDGRPQPPPHALPAGQAIESDGDSDNPKDVDGNPDPDTTDLDNDNYTPGSYLYPDTDDKETLAYGKVPSSAERTEIANVVTRYYAAAAKADGAAACALIVPSLTKSIPRDYGSGAGPSYLRGGKTCAAVLTKLFKHDAGELAEPPTLVSMRVKGAAGQVVLGSRILAASLLDVSRQGHTWRIQGLLGSPLP
jgi:hypothetical protein